MTNIPMTVPTAPAKTAASARPAGQVPGETGTESADAFTAALMALAAGGVLLPQQQVEAVPAAPAGTVPIILDAAPAVVPAFPPAVEGDVLPPVVPGQSQEPIVQTAVPAAPVEEAGVPAQPMPNAPSGETEQAVPQAPVPAAEPEAAAPQTFPVPRPQILNTPVVAPAAEPAVQAQAAADAPVAATEPAPAVKAAPMIDPAAAPAPATPVTEVHAPDAPAPASRPAPPPATQVAMQILPLREGPDGVHRLTVHLNPVDLGPVSVVAEVRDGTVHLQLSGMEDGAHDALRAALPELRKELEDGGFSSCTLDLTREAPHGRQEHQNRTLPGPGRPPAAMEDVPLPDEQPQPVTRPGSRLNVRL
ncbi:flagellar hook-length control protein FliK [Spirillospora albida]|uniref:flagellar hook-length control protein FliK n=1 Tax=Spirillospora albida TaxID=58123 RepID=UPI0004C14737|nr:flagellar hook-length control protein FliK [Spirillospora albida]